jgi:hypothetical protein
MLLLHMQIRRYFNMLLLKWSKIVWFKRSRYLLGTIQHILKKSLKIPKGQSESVYAFCHVHKLLFGLWKNNYFGWSGVEGKHFDFDILMSGDMKCLQLVLGLGGSHVIIPVHGIGSIKTTRGQNSLIQKE